MKFLDFWRRHREAYQALLFDIDGTVATGRTPLPGAIELLAELRRDGTPFSALTNDGNNSPEEKSRILRSGGVDLAPAEIISCGAALDELVAERGWRGKTFFQLGDLGNPSYAEHAGLLVCRDEAKIDDCFGVLNGEAYYDWHNHMQAAINFFRRHPDRPYVVPNPDSYWPGKPGYLGVGAGGQARFICGMLREMGVEIEPVYLGKPCAPIYEHALHTLARRFPAMGAPDCGRILMLGDSLASDIKGGKACGMQTGLLLTGITGLAAARNAADDRRPAFIFESLG